VKKHLLPALSPIETAVVTGKPENSIIQFAAENDIDLIILSTHGRSGLTRWSFGRVAEKVLRRSPCPTVILRSRQKIAPEQFRRILVPLDGSVLAERVLEPAMEMTAVLNLNLIVMRVVEKERFPGFGYDGSEAAREEDEAQAYLREIHDRLAAQGVSCQTAITFGAAADEIVDFAEAEDVDIIMLSSRGKAGFDAWMFGSVAEKVMQGAACATLVIRQEPFPASAA
jgi:nucleotide-binding universal stress UspA family protein